jgi:class 3 adenylate cyclase
MVDLVGRTFIYEFRGRVPDVWAAMADTARYNAASGLPRHTIQEEPQADGSLLFLGRAAVGPVHLEWEDAPCNWVRERWLEHARDFRRGPLRRLVARFDLKPSAEGCRGVYRVEVGVRGAAGRLLLLGGFLRSAGATFHRLAQQADAFACGQRATPFDGRAPALKEGAQRRLRELAGRLAGSPYAHGLAEALASVVATGLEPDVQRLRPLVLARRWRVPDRQVVKLCLEATRLGLLELRWDLLCPRCRAAKAVVPALDQLPTGAHCSTCNIDYGRDFSRNVELSFRPAEGIRPIPEGEFCLLGPMSTPHIWVHITLRPGESRRIALDPPPGAWRLRTLEAGPELAIDHDASGFPEVVVTPDAVEAGPPAGPGEVVLTNASPWRRTVVVEDRRWLDDVLTADRVATLQAFRDMFSTEVLRPGDEVAIRQVTLLFSDLKGSTALYEAVGDAAAYRLVREHFAYLAGIVRDHEGCIVKTLGDAVLAAFHDPLQGLRAAIAMQERITGFNASAKSPVVLKLGLHMGPCIAVTLNERLDYFGSTVNLAARLQGESRGGDVVLSNALAELPAAGPVIAGHRPTQEEARLRGVQAPVGFTRLAVHEPPVP